MSAADIVRLVEHLGSELFLEGGNIRVKNGANLPESTLTSVKDNKPGILRTLSYDVQAKAAGFVIAIPGELYTLTVNKTSNVYMERMGGVWESWRETYQGRRERASWTKQIAKSDSFIEVLDRTKGYFEFMERMKGSES